MLKQCCDCPKQFEATPRGRSKRCAECREARRRKCTRERRRKPPLPAIPCAYCGKPLTPHDPRQKCHSGDCSRLYKNKNRREIRHDLEYKTKRSEYERKRRSKPAAKEAIKEKDRERRRKPEYKANRNKRARQNRPLHGPKINAYSRNYKRNWRRLIREAKLLQKLTQLNREAQADVENRSHES